MLLSRQKARTARLGCEMQSMQRSMDMIINGMFLATNHQLWKNKSQKKDWQEQQIMVSLEAEAATPALVVFPTLPLLPLPMVGASPNPINNLTSIVLYLLRLCCLFRFISRDQVAMGRRRVAGRYDAWRDSPRHRHQKVLEDVVRVSPLLHRLPHHVHVDLRPLAGSHSAVVVHLHLLVKVHHQLVEVHSDSDVLGSVNVKSVVDLAARDQVLGVLGWVHLQIVEPLLLSAGVLLPQDVVRVRLSPFFQKTDQNVGIFVVHPVSLSLKYVVVGLEPSVLFGQCLQFLDVLLSQTVTVVSAVLSSTLNRKRHVPHILHFRIIWVTSHHSSSSQPVSQHRSQVVDPIATCAVARDEDLIGVDHASHHKSADDGSQELFDVAFPPHIGGFLAGAGDEPDGAGGHVAVVEVEVVAVLFVVDCGGAVAAPMQPDDEGVTVVGTAALAEVLELHGLVADGELVAVEHGQQAGGVALLHAQPLRVHLWSGQHFQGTTPRQAHDT